MERSTVSFIVFVSAGAFAISLTQVAWYTDTVEGSNPHYGFDALVFGWLGLEDGVLAWFANPFLFATWYYMPKSSQIGAARLFALIAFVLAVSFLFCTEISTDASGRPHPIARFGLGYWLWLASIGIVFVSCLINDPKKPEAVVFESNDDAT